jgi:histone acetyltransferase (RNA polymerase elongator complex component)
VEIAYFGGSFTAISRELMHKLLALAQEYVEHGKVDGIRFSTRPDAVEDALLDSLAPYHISAIELGLQSLCDRVLALSERGHTAAVAMDACRRIVARGYPLCGQMMLGLPGSDIDDEILTARRICEVGATQARVYPTVVLRETPLERAMLRGEYMPLTVEQAVIRGASVMEIFEQYGVTLLRIGLCENEDLRGEQVAGGAHHPAMGELILGECYFKKMDALLAQATDAYQDKIARFSVSKGKCSQALGQSRTNANRLCEKYGLSRVCVVEDASLTDAGVRLDGIYVS